MVVTMPWIQLVASAIVILVMSKFLVRSADTISVKTGLGKTFIGFVLLAAATSLPELGTGISSILLVNEPDLAVGDALGSNIANLLIIAVLDTMWRNRPILNSVGTGPVLMCVAGIIITSVVIIAILVHRTTSFVTDWYISPLSIVLLLAFICTIALIYKQEKAQSKVDEEPSHNSSFARAIVEYIVSTITMVIAVVILADAGDRIASAMKWNTSFVGTQFLAISTSLPELATSIAAIRLKMPELALANLLGSNIFNHGAVLFADDMAFTNGALWSHVSEIHLLTGGMAILMTTVVIAGLLSKERNRPGKYWTIEAITLVSLYLITSLLVFRLS